MEGMEDIAPALLEQIQKDFRAEVQSSTKLKELLQLVTDGKATYVQAEDFAHEAGTILSQTLQKHITSATLPDGKMYFNIADRVLRPVLEEDHQLISDVAVQVQEHLNKKAGIGLKAQSVSVNEDRIEGIIDKVTDADSFDDVAWMLDEPIINFSQAVVDDTLKANIDFQGKAGLRPQIVRQAEHKCCEWCSRLEGKYDYPDVPHDVYRRHERCRCTVDYVPGKGKVQNVHTKGWKSEEEYAKIVARKQLGLKDAFISSLSAHPKRLASFTPSTLKAKLEAEGYEVKPLKNGSLKNVPFEEGGGYKVNFSDGGLFQYHPAKKSHHGGAYYKISTGKGGIKRYELDGTEKQEKN